MQIDLTPEEMNLIAQILTQTNLTANRDFMISYINQTNIILQKFKDVTPIIQEQKDGQDS